jgi:hypothetical protein
MFAPMEVPLLPIWLEMMDSRFVFNSFTSSMMETAKSMDWVLSLLSDIMITSKSFYHIAPRTARFCEVWLRQVKQRQSRREVLC